MHFWSLQSEEKAANDSVVPGARIAYKLGAQNVFFNPEEPHLKKNPLLAFAACLIGFAAFTCCSPAQDTPVTPEPTAPGTPGQHPGGRGHHPAIRAAIGALERAKADMQAAAHDFGGHRVDAIAACDAAIAQLKLALQYAKDPAATPTAPPSP